MGHQDQRTPHGSSQIDSKATPPEKDSNEQIAALENRLGAYSARASHTQARLLATFDLLDALRSQHALELSSEREAKHKLSQDLDRSRTYARALEAERDDLKDAVDQLIQKVEISNDMSQWPYSCLTITRHAECVPEPDAIRGETQDWDGQSAAYASSLIARLRMELDRERKAHRQTYKDANLRIEELQAQVAVRDSELEISIHQSTLPQTEGIAPLRRHRKTRTSVSRVSPPQTMTDEECLRVLENNSARNKSLQAEILVLSQRLEKARAAPNSPSPKGPSRGKLETYAGSPGDTGVDAPEQTDATSSRRPTHSPTSPLTGEPSAQRPSLSPTPAPALTATQAPNEVLAAISSLEAQIKRMGSQVDAFKAEKAAFLEIAVRDKRAANGAESDGFGHILLIEEECIRLSVRLAEVEQQLKDSQSAAKTRETQLLGEIERLKNSSARQSSPRLYHAYGSEHLDDDIDAEESMELATPLQPTTILSARDPQTESPLVDPLLIPLPFLPERESSPATSSVRLPRRGSSPHHEKLNEIQFHLAQARTQLAGKEKELAELRIAMEDLRRQISTGHPDITILAPR
ncbi:hypothetical protein BV22DRAFT_1028714 [Leucogyrophana mollusca]|uniref:Uncharacterized protein n=1 Tax=Leucogyrophana mollusca TaxID=85980 RepID=A0ACB8BYP6_9AGAM|nr:hypothetical protein BV22DRAFT_1028714 [Leucogyrophana mollusca]